MSAANTTRDRVIRCAGCGVDAPVDARFCPACGSRLSLPCTQCGAHNAAGFHFCTQCGLPLATLSPPQRFATPFGYTPRHLVEQIAHSRVALEGERKQVTILFADLRGSMELLAGRDPEDARRVLDPVLELMIEAVHRFEGTVNQVMGDGIMALFGAPLAHEDHAIRACYAALHMQEAMERHARGAPASGPPVQIRVGINSGEVVVRAIGSDLRMDYTAVGESTHIAARLEQRAEPGTILVTAHTARLAGGYVDLEALPPMPVKGLGEPLAVHRLTGARTMRSRLYVSAARGFTPFVGRDDELTRLQRALDAVAKGRGQVVAVVGEPGVGKSRLVWESLGGRRAAGWLVLEASAVPYRLEYLPVAALIRGCLGLSDRDGVDATREKICAALPVSGGAHLRSALLALFDVPIDDDQWHTLDVEARRRRTIDAFSELLSARSTRQPVCVVVEDLQWADAETRAVLDGLVDALPASRIALIVTYRPEFEHRWSGKSFYHQIRVDPLSAAEVDRLLLRLVGPDADLASLRAVLVERTEGNPFFLEESVRNFLETGVLVDGPGVYRLAGAAQPAIPDSVHAVLAARIDRLSPADKRVLETASAVGRDIPLMLLRAIVDVSDDVLDSSLARLRAGEFLYQTVLDGDPGYMFNHALTLDVTYAGLVTERRRDLDARIVDAMERLHPDRNAEVLDRLAHHALRGQVWSKAVLYCREAGARAGARSAHRAAAVYFERALAAHAHLAQTAESLADGIDIRLDLRYALGALAEYRRVLAILTEAETLARKLDDPLRLARVSAFLTNYFTLAGKLEEAIAHGERARRVVEPIDDVPLAAVTHAFLAAAYYARGDYRQAALDAGWNVDLLVGDRERERFGMAQLTSVYSRTIMAWSLSELGEFDRAATVAAGGLRIAEAAEQSYSVVFALLGIGTVHLRRGEFDAAIAALERASTLCREIGLLAALLELTGPLASAYVQSGRADEAVALLQRVIAEPVASAHAFGRLLRTAGLGEAYAACGRAADALPLAEKFLEPVRAAGARGLEAWAGRLVGECAARLATPDVDRAERSLDAALGLANELGMRPLAGRCHLSRAELFRRTGRPDEAHAEATTAVALFSSLRMTSWTKKADGAC